MFEIDFPLFEASAEDVPLPSVSFDLAVSESGGSIWCDPRLWIPEAPSASSCRTALVPPQQHPPDNAVARSYHGTCSVEWARKWPSEEIWVVEQAR